MKYEITKEQINELLKESDFAKLMFPKWIPEAFETKLEVGKWYKSESLLGVYNADNLTYGFFEGKFGNEWLMTDYGFYTPATETEVFEALKKEAVKRGFVDGVKATGLDGDVFTVNTLDFWNADKFDLDEEKKFFISATTGNCGVIFRYGKWAEIIKEKTLSKSEAEAMINEFKKDGYAYKIG